MKPNDGGPAFPEPVVDSANHGVVTGAAFGLSSGMSLRDYFAAKALSGMLANPERTGGVDADWAEFAYNLADAMITARDKKAEVKSQETALDKEVPF